MSRRRLILIVGGLIIGVITLYCVLMLVPEPANSAFYFFRVHGVGMDTVTQLSQVYGVDIRDISTYGDDPFPVNYIKYRLGWKNEKAARPTIYRRDVEAVVKGYISICELRDTETLYLFYSKRLAPTFFGQTKALVMSVRYTLDIHSDGKRPDQVLEAIEIYDPADSGPYEWYRLTSYCTPSAES